MNMSGEQEQKMTAMVFEQLPRESNKAFAAFKTYLDMGPARSLAAVCDKLGKHRTQLERWSRKFDWHGRVTARDAHLAELERHAIERLAVEKAVEWWQLQEPTRRQAWIEAEEAIASVREARQRWRESGRIPTFGGMARMLDLAFKLKQFATGMPSEVKEVHNLHAGKVSLEWEEAIRKAYGENAEIENRKPETVVDVEEVKP